MRFRAHVVFAGVNQGIVMPHYVDKQADFEDLCKKLNKAEAIGVDTEFIGEFYYYPKLALVQLAALGEVWLVDPVAIEDMAPLAKPLSREDTTVIMHNAETDLMILNRACGSDVKNLFDTQVAAAFVGMTEQIGLTSLVKRTVGKRLAKGQQVTNWLKRPLSDKQLHYAANDVLYLEKIYKELNSELKKTKRVKYYKEEIKLREKKWLSPVDIDIRFKSMLSSARTMRSLEARRGILNWREDTARTKDKPRRHVLSDEAILAIADHMPQSESDLKIIRLVSDKAARRYGKHIVKLCHQYSKIPDERIPSKKTKHHANSRVRSRTPLVKMAMEALAQEAGIAHGLIARASEIQDLCRAAVTQSKPPKLPCLTGWRGRLVGRKLWLFARGEASLRIGLDPNGPAVIMKENDIK